MEQILGLDFNPYQRTERNRLGRVFLGCADLGDPGFHCGGERLHRRYPALPKRARTSTAYADQPQAVNHAEASSGTCQSRAPFFPDRGFFYRSDQFNFAKIGVPAIYLDSGTEFLGKPDDWGKKQVEDYEANRYHQPSDEFDPEWTYDGMIEDAQLGFYAGLSIADNPQLPAWNPGDEFEAARRKALGDVKGK